MKFLIVAAKTGGHVFPAATVSKKLINNDHQIILIGTGNKIEINAYEDLNSKQYKLNIDGFRGKNVFIKTKRFRTSQEMGLLTLFVNTLSICFICIAIFLRKLYGAL